MCENKPWSVNLSKQSIPSQKGKLEGSSILCFWRYLGKSSVNQKKKKKRWKKGDLLHKNYFKRRSQGSSSRKCKKLSDDLTMSICFVYWCYFLLSMLSLLATKMVRKKVITTNVQCCLLWMYKHLYHYLKTPLLYTEAIACHKSLLVYWETSTQSYCNPVSINLE